MLPITIDVGTNNEKLLGDPQYLGVQEPRLTGDDYFELLDEFMVAVYRRWPNVIVQFEDFETPKAVPLLERYRNKYRCFNDDIQGTGSVTLSGLLSAARNAGTSVKDLRIVCAGAGSAGLGVCQQILDGMVEAGLTHEEAQKNFCVLTSKGALGKADGAKGDPNHSSGRINDLTRPWVNEGVSDGLSLHELIEEFKPNTLLGLSTQKGIFDKEACQLIAAIHDRPIIMPMSNPTSKSECTPQQAYEWTDYRAVVATGSPFDAVEKPDGTVLIPSQCNNMYIFPGIGLAASISGICLNCKTLFLFFFPSFQCALSLITARLNLYSFIHSLLFSGAEMEFLICFWASEHATKHRLSDDYR